MIGGPPIIEFEKTNRTVTCKKIGAKTLSLNFLGQGSLTYGLIYESLRQAWATSGPRATSGPPST